jgi:hypothetical protein
MKAQTMPAGDRRAFRKSSPRPKRRSCAPRDPTTRLRRPARRFRPAGVRLGDRLCGSALVSTPMPRVVARSRQIARSGAAGAARRWTVPSGSGMDQNRGPRVCSDPGELRGDHPETSKTLLEFVQLACVVPPGDYAARQPAVSSAEHGRASGLRPSRIAALRIAGLGVRLVNSMRGRWAEYRSGALRLISIKGHDRATEHTQSRHVSAASLRPLRTTPPQRIPFWSVFAARGHERVRP